jgi:hypothetical protein
MPMTTTDNNKRAENFRINLISRWRVQLRINIPRFDGTFAQKSSLLLLLYKKAWICGQ